MKRFLLALSCALLSAPCIFAQITLNQGSYTSTFAGTNDTVLQSITSSTYPNLTAATNATWDVTSSVSTIAIASLPHVNPYTTAFASAQYADSGAFAFGPFNYIATVQNAITASAFLEYGQHIYRKAYTLVGVAPLASSTDSFVIDAQNDIYSTPRTAIAFPATYHNTWTSNYRYDFNYHLTYALQSYNNAPGYVRIFVTEVDSVVGWGQMKVKQLNGNASGYMNVLQIRSDVAVEDSFYLNGGPAPANLLAAFNVSQGQISNSYSQYYMRPNEVTPLAALSFSDSTYSTPSSAQTHAQRLPPGPAGIQNIAKENIITIYPNPVNNNSICIDMPYTQNGDWKYELINMDGKVVIKGGIALLSNKAQINFPNSISPGIYYLILNNNQEQLVRPLNIVK